MEYKVVVAYDIANALNVEGSNYKSDLKEELLHYLCLLVGADKRVTDEEVKFINENLGYAFDKALLKDRVKLYSGMKTSFTYILSVDKFIKQIEDRTDEVLSLLKGIITIVEELGLKFLSCDDKATTKETKIYNSFNYSNKARINELISEVALMYLDDAYDEEEAIEENVKEESLEELMEELNSLVGLEEVKSEINSLINLVKVRKLREERGFNNIPMSFHMVFYGNPGTGKTTVARLLAKIYKCLGLLSKGQLVEVDRSGLVAGYIGQTAIKTKEVCDSALGGILFIDEAYALTYNKTSGDYGTEAIDTLIKFMEDNRNDFIVVAAGYPEPMADFMEANPGMKSRFTKYISFEDYTADELLTIFEGIAKKNSYTISDGLKDKLKRELENLNLVDFGNARGVRTIFETAVMNQASRVIDIPNIDDEALVLLTELDI